MRAHRSPIARRLRTLLAQLAAGAMLVLALQPVASAACRTPDFRSAMPGGPVALKLRNEAGVSKLIYSRSHALLVGESNYRGGLRQLPSIPHELDNLRQALEIQGFDVTVYQDLDSTQLNETIDCYFTQTLPSDPGMRFLFWYAGHATTLHEGLVAEGDGFMLPVDVNKPGAQVSDQEARTKGMRYSKFIYLARNVVNAKHALFVFDSCFSGILLDAPNRSGYEPPPLPAPRSAAYAFSEQVQSPAREFLTSGTASQEVPAAGLFAEYFTKALLGERREADDNGDNLLIGDELQIFMKQYVSQDSHTQTPTFGTLKESRYKGDIVFSLPPKPAGAELIAAVTVPGAETPGGMRPVYRGAVSATRGADGSATGDTLVQFFETDSYLRTDATDCSSDCSAPGKSRQYRLALLMPAGAPANALLDVPELQCISGPCAAGGRLLDGPVLSDDRRSASATLLGWGQPSIWRLTARLVMPAEAGRAPASGGPAGAAATRVVVDSGTGKVATVGFDEVTVSAKAVARNLRDDAALGPLIEAMQSENTTARRTARVRLGVALEDAAPDTVTQLIRRMPGANYRYQIGMAEALKVAKGGWLSGDPASRALLVQLQKKSNIDPTLKASLGQVLLNQRLFAYYETAGDQLTPAGRLMVKGQPRSRVAPFGSLQPGNLLLAEDGVQLRAGAGTGASKVTVLQGGECVQVVRRDRAEAGAPSNGGWLQVLLRRTCSVNG